MRLFPAIAGGSFDEMHTLRNFGGSFDEMLVLMLKRKNSDLMILHLAHQVCRNLRNFGEQLDNVGGGIDDRDDGVFIRLFR
jgi:hypothetical protein